MQYSECIGDAKISSAGWSNVLHRENLVAAWRKGKHEQAAVRRCKHVSIWGYWNDSLPFSYTEFKITDMLLIWKCPAGNCMLMTEFMKDIKTEWKCNLEIPKYMWSLKYLNKRFQRNHTGNRILYWPFKKCKLIGSIQRIPKVGFENFNL